jgi:hypothetical protein
MEMIKGKDNASTAPVPATTPSAQILASLLRWTTTSLPAAIPSAAWQRLTSVPANDDCHHSNYMVLAFLELTRQEDQIRITTQFHGKTIAGRQRKDGQDE